MKIKNKMTIPLLLIVMAGAVGVLLVFYLTTVKNFHDENARQLEILAGEKAYNLEVFFHEKKNEISTLVVSPSVRNILRQKLHRQSKTVVNTARTRAEEVAGEVSRYIESHSDMTLRQLQMSAEFRDIAIQSVGEQGYTAIGDYDELLVRLHPDEKYIDMDMAQIARISPSYRTVVSQSKGGRSGSGFYDWPEPDGTVKEKYMYIVAVDPRTADGAGLTVAATAYVEEFVSGFISPSASELFLRRFIERGVFDDLYLVDKQGIVTWSAKHSIGIGTDLYTGRYSDKNIFKVFEEALEKKTVAVSDFDRLSEDGEVKLFFSSPVYDDKSDQLSGSLIAEISSERIDKIMHQQMGLGESEESFLVGADFLLRSNSRFSVFESILITRADTDKVRKCFDYSRDKSEESYVIFENYRNIRVYGASRYMDQYGWCLLVEVSADEVEKPLKVALARLIGVFVAYFFLLYFAVRLVAKQITNRLKRLQKGMSMVEKGNLKLKLANGDKDEIGALATSFDKLAEKLDQSFKDTGKKVKKQTAEIEQSRRDLKNQQKAILNILEDVEEDRVRVSKERDRISTILQSIGDAVFVLDTDSNIIMLNKMGENMSGYTFKEVVGKHYRRVFRFVKEKDGAEIGDFVSEAMSTGEVVKLPLNSVLITKDGNRVPVGDSAAPVRDTRGNIIGCVVVFRDITREREIDRTKTEFVSLASHQLRTPLSTIRWYVEMLSEADSGELNEEQTEYVKEIEKGNMRMIDLVNALLNVSRLELGTFSVQPKKVSLKKMVNEVLDDFIPVIEQKKLKVRKKVSKKIPKLNYDPDLTRIILQNLISNAVKYTPKQGRIIVDVKKQKQEENILIEVADTGFGIPKKQQKHIFEKLFRADNVKEKDTTGTGLGLYMVKSILDQVGGKIWFKSKLKQGTVFYVTLPLTGMRKKKGKKRLT